MDAAEVWLQDARLRSGPAAADAEPLPVRKAAEMLLGAPEGERLTVDAHGVNLQILRHMLQVGGRVKVRSFA